MKTSAHTSSLALFATALLLAACDSGSAIPATDIGIDHALSFSDSIAEMLGEDAPRSLDATREDATSDTSILNDGMSKEDHGPCVPSCPGRTCGNDGCGGRCGSCSGESICSQAGSCVKAIYPPSGHETGVDYHATGSDFLTTAFLTRYHQPQVRTLVKSQLAGMRQAGATVISTRIWLVSPPGTTGAYSWKHHFPLNTQEIANIRAYAQDVASAKLKLYIIFLYLWCAEYSVGSPTATLGHCGLSAPSFVSRVKQSINGVLDNIHDIYLSNGLPVVERVYLDGEVMTASSASDPATAFEKKNQRWFLKDSGLWSYFVNQVRHEGMIPMLYFIHGNGETDILDEDFKDTYLPALTRHRSMYWIYRTLKFLKDNGLPIPGRVDFSSYPHPEHTNYATLFNRIFSDYASTIPTLLGGKKDFFVAETFYHPNAITRARAHRGLSLQYALRPSLRGISFWTTPDAGGTGVHAGYPFDIQGLNGSGLSFPNFANPSFEKGSTCGASDKLENPAGYCTEWSNGNVTSYQIGRSNAAALDGTMSLRLHFGACATVPCGGSAFPGIYVLSAEATKTPAKSWAVTRLWARYSGTDHAAQAVLIDNATVNVDEVSFLKGNVFREYVLIGQTNTGKLTLRGQVIAPKDTNTDTYIDLLH